MRGNWGQHCIDRGASTTVIEDGEADNPIQGHNVRVGAHTAIAAAGAVGSADIGAPHGGMAAVLLCWVTSAWLMVCITFWAVVTRSTKFGHYTACSPSTTMLPEKRCLRRSKLHLRERLRALEQVLADTKQRHPPAP
jgi:hypothetical protein